MPVWCWCFSLPSPATEMNYWRKPLCFLFLLSPPPWHHHQHWRPLTLHFFCVIGGNSTDHCFPEYKSSFGTTMPIHKCTHLNHTHGNPFEIIWKTFFFWWPVLTLNTKTVVVHQLLFQHLCAVVYLFLLNFCTYLYFIALLCFCSAFLVHVWYILWYILAQNFVGFRLLVFVDVCTKRAFPVALLLLLCSFAWSPVVSPPAPPATRQFVNPWTA